VPGFLAKQAGRHESHSIGFMSCFKMMIGQWLSVKIAKDKHEARFSGASPKSLIRTALFIVAFNCLTQSLVSGSGIYRTDPEAGTLSLAALRSFNVGIWYDQRNVSEVIFNLNGARIIRSREDFRDGYSQATFGPGVWGWGTNVVCVTLVDGNGNVLNRSNIVYEIFKPSDQAPSEGESGSASPVGTWERSYSYGSASQGNQMSATVTIQIRPDGTGTGTEVDNGYADPNMRYDSELGIGNWTSTTTERFKWVEIVGGQFSMTTTGGEIGGVTRYFTNAGPPQIGYQSRFYISGAVLHFTTGDHVTFTRAGN
jgi:hypothetical protein